MRHGIFYFYVPEHTTADMKEHIVETTVKNSKEFFTRAGYTVLYVAIHDLAQVRFEVV